MGRKSTYLRIMEISKYRQSKDLSSFNLNSIKNLHNLPLSENLLNKI